MGGSSPHKETDMPAKKIFAAFLIVLGAVAFSSGLTQYKNCQTPNHCVVGFAKSLGGQASFELDQTVRRERYFGIAKMIGGVFFIAASGVFLIKSFR